MYVTLDEFGRSPTHGIDCNDLVPNGTDEENALALSEMLAAAEAMVNAECDVDTFAEATSTETFYTTMNRRGEVIVRPRNFPVTGVTSVKYRTHPSQAWTDVALTNVEHTTRSITIRGSMADIVVNGAAIAGSYVTPHEFDRLAKAPLTLQVTYTSGYAADDMPQDVKLATILFAADLIGERGSASITMNGSPSVMGGSPYDATRGQRAKSLLKRYRR